MLEAMELDKWIKSARAHAKWTQEQLGNAVGRTKANVGHWETGKHAPSYEMVRKISEATGCPMPESGVPGSWPPLEEASNDTPTRNGFAIHQIDTGGRMGSSGLLLRDQPGVIRAWHVSHEWMQQNVHRITSPANLAIVTGFGDSMRPLYNPGDPLLVDTGRRRVDVDGIYFFRVGEEGFIKRLQRIPTAQGTVIRAKSENPAYDPFEITIGMDFEVFGWVVKAWRGEDF